MAITRAVASSITQGLPKQKTMLAGNSTILPGSYESIATVTVGAGGQSTITFSSIPSTYKHLQIRAIARNTVASSGAEGNVTRFNSDSGTNYAYHALSTINVLNFGNPYASAATSQTNMYTGISVEGGELASSFAVAITDILDYTNTSKNKTVRNLVGANTNGGIDAVVFRSGVWLSTSAITSIDITSTGGNFAQYSQFALYGIK